MINQKVARIHPDLDEARILFNQKISVQLGINSFPKVKSDIILAKAIKNQMMDFEIKKRGYQIFDIKWK